MFHYLLQGTYHGQWSKGTRHGFGIRKSAFKGLSAPYRSEKKSLNRLRHCLRTSSQAASSHQPPATTPCTPARWTTSAQTIQTSTREALCWLRSSRALGPTHHRSDAAGQPASPRASPSGTCFSCDDSRVKQLQKSIQFLKHDLH